jgi:hypothetical protein
MSASIESPLAALRGDVSLDLSCARLHVMAPKHHPTPLSGGDRKALAKELTRVRAMTRILAERANEKRAAGEALIRNADDLLCQSWNERM